VPEGAARDRLSPDGKNTLAISLFRAEPTAYPFSCREMYRTGTPDSGPDAQKMGSCGFEKETKILKWPPATTSGYAVNSKVQGVFQGSVGCFDVLSTADRCVSSMVSELKAQ